MFAARYAFQIFRLVCVRKGPLAAGDRNPSSRISGQHPLLALRISTTYINLLSASRAAGARGLGGSVILKARVPTRSGLDGQQSEPVLH